MEATLSESCAAYLQYVDMATERIVSKIQDIPFVKESLPKNIHDFTQGMLELRIDTSGIYEGIEDDVVRVLTTIFNNIGKDKKD